MTLLPHLRPLVKELDRTDDWTAALSTVDPTDMLAGLAEDLGNLTPDGFDAIAGKSREVATHYAWCLFDEPRPYSLWINEYKPTRDWHAGYANVIHNHRYDFCSAILAGGYLEQLFDTEMTLSTETRRDRGTVRLVRAEDFHRIPHCDDGTITLLVKSPPRQPASMSFDPASGTSRLHVPIEARRDLFIDGLTRERRVDATRRDHRAESSMPPAHP